MIDAGGTAARELDAVKQNLGAASTWGKLDILGGGFGTSVLKHSKIDKAKRSLRSAHRQLIRFQEELVDVNEQMNLPPELKVDGFLKFVDVFVDGLIVDWMVQSRVQKTASECTATLNQVNSALEICRRKRSDLALAREHAVEQRRKLIEGV